MGQKVNPICLRLHPENKHFDSCWFSEKQYAHSIHKIFNVEIYYNAILKQIQYPSASFFFEGAPRKSRFSVLFLNPALLRERAFKQFGNVNGINRKVKRNTLFSTKKKKTFLYGLPEKKGGFLRFLPSHFLTSPFLQNLKKTHTVSGVFDKVKNKEKKNITPFFPLGEAKASVLQKSIFARETKNRGRALQKKGVLQKCIFARETKNKALDFCTADTKSRHSETRKVSNISLYTRQERRGRQTLEKTSFPQKDLQLKKNVCSSVLGLSILRYFVQRNLNENLLSASSRFLLLQAFFCFLKIQKRPLALPRASLCENVVPCKKTFLHHIFAKQNICSANVKARGASTGRETPSTPAEARKSDLFYNLQKSGIYTYHIESLISKSLKSSCKIFFFKAQNVAQNALFIAEEIVYQLERRNTFRQIKNKFLQELGNKPGIKGVRVTCVGRIGGRAKKAQRARGESFKMGQTSLHLFDSKVSFASKTALTAFGAVGVKVWICWK